MDVKVDYRTLTRTVEGLGSLDQNVLDALAALIREYVVQMLADAVALVPKKTGRLADHLIGRIDKGSASVYGIVGTRGVAYAHFQEHGFHGTESFAASLRTVKQVFGRPITATQAVRAHVRQLDYSGQPFLLPVLERYWPEIQQAMIDTVARTVRENLPS